MAFRAVTYLINAPEPLVYPVNNLNGLGRTMDGLSFTYSTVESSTFSVGDTKVAATSLVYVIDDSVSPEDFGELRGILHLKTQGQVLFPVDDVDAISVNSNGVTLRVGEAFDKKLMVGFINPDELISSYVVPGEFDFSDYDGALATFHFNDGAVVRLPVEGPASVVLDEGTYKVTPHSDFADTVSVATIREGEVSAFYIAGVTVSSSASEKAPQ